MRILTAILIMSLTGTVFAAEIGTVSNNPVKDTGNVFILSDEKLDKNATYYIMRSGMLIAELKPVTVVKGVGAVMQIQPEAAIAQIHAGDLVMDKPSSSQPVQPAQTDPNAPFMTQPVSTTAPASTSGAPFVPMGTSSQAPFVQQPVTTAPPTTTQPAATSSAPFITQPPATAPSAPSQTDSSTPFISQPPSTSSTAPPPSSTSTSTPFIRTAPATTTAPAATSGDTPFKTIKAPTKDDSSPFISQPVATPAQASPPSAVPDDAPFIEAPTSTSDEFTESEISGVENTPPFRPPRSNI